VIGSRALSKIRTWPTAARLRYWLYFYPDTSAQVTALLPMPESTNFNCPMCNALYKLVRAEAPAANDKPLICLGCGGPLRHREGKFALKYFRVSDGVELRRGKTPKLA
jgi:uncharacterized Zn-finger protein